MFCNGSVRAISRRAERKAERMLPLSLAQQNEEVVIKKVGGSPEVKKHLEDLGFVIGGTVSVITALNGNLIVRVKESRVAIDDAMARKIMV